MPLPNRAERRKRISNYRKPGKLDAYNEALAQRGLHLHPTKGYRKLPYKRLVAALVTEDMKQGRGGVYHVWEAAQAFKRARQRTQNPEVPLPSSEAPQGEEVISEEEQARRKWAYGSGSGTLAGSDDL
jgi:hypothetical protein